MPTQSAYNYSGVLLFSQFGTFGATFAITDSWPRRGCPERSAGAASRCGEFTAIDGTFDPSDGTRGTRGAARTRVAGVPAASPRRRCPTRRCRIRWPKQIDVPGGRVLVRFCTVGYDCG